MKIEKWLGKNLASSYKGKTFLITGGNSGIGYEFAKLLTRFDANVIITVRNDKRGEEAKNSILKEYPSASIRVMHLDLADFSSINEFSDTIKKEKIDIDYFFNNAGVYRLPYSLTPQGLEVQTGTNFVGTLLLMNNLIDYFLSLKHEVKICFTGSVTSYYYKLSYNHFYPDENDKPIHTYANTKTMTIHMYHYFLEKYQDTNLEFYLAHPGSTYTPLIAKGYKNQAIRLLGRRFMKIFFHMPNKACLTYAYVLKDIPNGSFIVPRGIGELSGYPKLARLKKKYLYDYLKTIDIGNKLIEEHS